MANAWQNPSLIASEAITNLSDNLIILPLTGRDVTNEFNKTPNGYAKGDTISMKQRPDFEAKEFVSTVDIQDIRSTKRQMTIEKHFDVSVQLTAKEKRMNLDELSAEVIQPAALRLAEKVDKYIGSKLANAHGLYTSTNLLGDAADIAQVRKAATLQQLDPAGRFALLNEDAEATLLGQTFFNQSQTRGADGETTLREGQLGRVMGIDWHASVNFPVISGTYGNGTGVTKVTPTGTENVVGQNVLTLNTGSAGTYEVGDHIKVAGLKRPMRVAVQAVATSTSITLVDPITEIIPENAAVTVISAGNTDTIQGAIFDSHSIGVAMPVLDPADDKPSHIISENGVSIRVVSGYDMSTKTSMLSLDCLIGAELWDPRRITLLGDH